MSLLARTAVRSTRSFAFAPRAFSTSLVTRKTAKEAVRDTVKTVDRKVSDKIVGGIELGQTATKKAKSVVGLGSEDAKARAEHFTERAKERAHEAAGEARGKANEAAGEVKGKANEAAKEAREKLNETKRKM